MRHFSWNVNPMEVGGFEDGNFTANAFLRVIAFECVVTLFHKNQGSSTHTFNWQSIYLNGYFKAMKLNSMKKKKGKTVPIVDCVVVQHIVKI